MNNVTIIIFGATGDLAKRKLLPAIYKLVEDKKIDSFAIVGVALEKTTADAILHSAKNFIKHCDDTIFNIMQQRMNYYQLDLTNQVGYVGLKRKIESIEKEYALTNRLVYCSTAAHFFSDITRHCAETALLLHEDTLDNSWHRIVYEKPFGKDLSSACHINACIQQYLSEQQVFRIDHYLSKEIVANIALVRFTNIVFEPLWSKKYIDQVHIILSEKIAIENRGWYYDQYGAIRDIVQNHALELLALVAMEQPKHLVGEYIRDERAKVLKNIQFVDGIKGQYASYLQEQGVLQDSKTETFACLMFEVQNERWSGVPFIVKTGKALSKKETVIHIKFKQTACLLAKGCSVESNWLTIKIDPEAILLLTLNAKQPGKKAAVIPVGMEFCHSCLFGPRTPEAYEILFEEILQGEQSISVRQDEIEYAWKVIDQINQKNLPLYVYQEKSNGPKEMGAFEKKHNIWWKE